MRTIYDLNSAINQHFDKVMSNFFNPQSIGDLKNKFLNSSYPKADAYWTPLDSPTSYVIEIDVPGVKPDDLSVRVESKDNESFCNTSCCSGVDPGTGYVLVVEGQRVQKTEGVTHDMRELRSSKFIRHFTLPDSLDGEPAAEMEHGVLRLTWKVKGTKPLPETKKVPIKVKS